MSYDPLEPQKRELLDAYGRAAHEVQGDTLSPPGVIIQGGQVIRFESLRWFPGAPFNQAAMGGVIVGPNDVPPGADRAEFRLTVPVTGLYRFSTHCLFIDSPAVAGDAADMWHECTPADTTGKTRQKVRAPGVTVAGEGYIPVHLDSYWRLQAGTLYVFQALAVAVVGGNWLYYVDPDYASATLSFDDLVTG